MYQYRPIECLGEEFMRKSMTAKVLVAGVNGLGIEIAKTVLLLADVNTLTLWDQKDTQWGDLGSQFYLRPEDVGKNRALSCLKRVRELNPNVQVEAVTSELTTELAAQHSIVVLVDVPYDKAVEINNFCRAQYEEGVRPAIYFIQTDCRGLAASIFTDFGPRFIVKDSTGEESEECILANIEEDGKFHVVSEEQITFGDGAFVTFREVEGDGIDVLNDGVPRKVTDVHPFSFRLDPADPNNADLNYGGYVTGGIVTEQKMEREMSFKSLEECLADPGMPEDCDMAKFGRSLLLHSFFRALDAFAAAHDGAMPEPGNAEHIAEVVKRTSDLNEQAAIPVEVDPNVVGRLANGAKACLNPMAAFIGGLVGQEVIKAATGKFTPFFQNFYFDSVECLPVEDIAPEEFAPQGCRYDDQIAVFGKSFQDKLVANRWLLCGAGATGREFLKNFALMGVGASPEGKVTVTDDDVIEARNLSRQFLLRECDVMKSKGESAAGAAKEMNPDFNPSTENIFDDDFWGGLTGACNALANIKARLYLDSRCLFYEKPLLDTGAMGPKFHTQVCLPHKSESWSEVPLPPSREPCEPTTCHPCNFFPYKAPQCLRWARSDFRREFETLPAEVAQMHANPDGYFQALAQRGMEEYDQQEKAREIRRFLEQLCSTFEECVAWALHQFHYCYHRTVVDAIERRPRDRRFWAPPKRFPTPLAFDANDSEHMDFVIAAANLRANICGIAAPTEDNQNRNPDYIRAILENVVVDEGAFGGGIDEEETLEEAIAAVPRDRLSAMQPEALSLEDDANHHLDFLRAAGNLRARTYRIPEVGQLEAKLLLRGYEVPYPSVVGAGAGLLCLELIKIVNGRDVGDWKTVGSYRNSGNNLAWAQISLYDTSAPKAAEDWVEEYDGFEGVERTQHKAVPPGWTAWDKIVVDITPDTTIQNIVDDFNERYEVKLEALGFETLRDNGNCLMVMYAEYLPRTVERLPNKFYDVWYRTVKKDISGERWIRPAPSFLTKEDEDADLPSILFKLQDPPSPPPVEGGEGGVVEDV